MRPPGTPGFLGERLREAREARSVSGIALAADLGVSKQAVSQYEIGAATPAPEVLARMCQILNMPERFFGKPIERDAVGTLFYRSYASALKTHRLRSGRRYGWLKEIVYHLNQFVELPQQEFPDAETNPLTLKNADIERIAEEVRKEFGLGADPAPDMVAILENHGAVVSRFAVGTEALDAFSEWSEGESRPYFVLSADKDSAVRSRLDAAHELGHMVLHRSVPRELLESKATFDLIEKQAFYFAGAFLLPAKEFSDDFFYPTLSELLRLKKVWGVAMAAALKRCQDLDLLPMSEITRLWVAMGREGYRKREPLDDETEPEQPRLLRDSFELLINEGVRTRRQLRDAIAFSEGDIESLAGLPRGFFDEPPSNSAPVVELRARPPRTDPPTPPGAGGRVVTFPKKG